MSRKYLYLIILLALSQLNYSVIADTGPTIYLCCRDTNNQTNLLSDFMYFVPLISPVDVTNEKSENNQQIGYVISCTKDSKKKSFKSSCEFRMEGQGSNLNDFDKEGMIERNKKNVKEGDDIKNILDYIKFNGEGYGKIDIFGDIENGEEVVKKVVVHFNARGSQSPVYAGLYSVKSENGNYSYDNKYDTKVARVNTLTFVENQDIPKMDIKVASVGKDEESLGILQGIIGSIANLVIQPFEITQIGNDEMLRLGLALYNEQKKFTFPKAENLIPKSEQGN
ncbi:MAG: hypothetical protein A2Y10_05095 [Planctomycetes bacterium GWF2_41_51]|nr:MAG: hypothetical protein A2Y10_05095 [Planctomycetes bacterium GWF2_41_51]HBG25559.1 hypothetical protein [Phycisphaerales bacterium]